MMRLPTARLFDGRRFLEECSVVVEGDRIRGVDRHVAASSDRADLLVVPGFIDAHLHLHQIARFLDEIELDDAGEPKEIVARIRNRTKGGWHLGRRLDHPRWRPRAGKLRAALDEAFPETPVRLLFSDGHSAVLNREGVRRVLAWQAVGRLGGIHLEEGTGGEPTGLALDGDLELSQLPFPDPSAPVVDPTALAAAAAECARHGITTAHNLLVTLPEFLELRDAGLEALRIYCYLSWQDFDEVVHLREELGTGFESGRLRIRGIKCFADGSLGSGGALLTRPYRGSPENCGMEVLTTGEIAALARRCLDHGLQLAVHALGDRGVANVLDAFEAVFDGDPSVRDHRFRIEHAEVVRPEDIQRCRRLGVVVSMQPYHFTDDARWLPQRLPSELLEWVAPWRSFLRAGVPLCFGSDAPYTNISVVDGLRSAVRRLDTVKTEHRAFFRDEAVGLAEALGCYSHQGAWAVFEEGGLGTVAPGAPADLTVVDGRLQRVLATVAGGRITWSSEDWAAIVHQNGLEWPT
jgi:predicted amidohydrolase YtcJ